MGKKITLTESQLIDLIKKTINEIELRENSQQLDEGLKSMAAGVLVALASILPNKSLAQKAENTDVKPTRTEMELAQKIKKDLENKAHTVEVDTLINVQPGDSVYANLDDQQELIDLQQGIKKKYFDEKGEFLGDSYEIDTKFQGGKSDKWVSAVSMDDLTALSQPSRSEISKASQYKAIDLSDTLVPQIDSYFKIAYESIVMEKETNSVTNEMNSALINGRQEINKKIEEIKRINIRVGNILEKSFKEQLSDLWVSTNNDSIKEAPKFNLPF